MFKKLFKYDFRAIKRFALPILLVLGAATAIGVLDGLLFSRLSSTMGDDPGIAQIIFMIISYLVLMLANIAIGASATVVQVLVLVDYYKSTVSDEAYLTFTLPVKARDILLSKLLNSIIWTAIMGIASALAMLAVSAASASSLFSTSDIIPPSSEPVDYGNSLDGLWLFVLIIIACLIVYFINSQLVYFMAISFSSTLTRKNKVISAVGCVLLMNLVYGIVATIVMVIAVGIGIAGGGMSESPFVTLNIAFGIITLILIGATVLFYYLTKKMLENKINLA